MTVNHDLRVIIPALEERRPNPSKVRERLLLDRQSRANSRVNEKIVARAEAVGEGTQKLLMAIGNSATDETCRLPSVHRS